MPETERVPLHSIIENLISIHPLLSKNLTRSIRDKTNLNPGSMYVLGLLSKNATLTMSEIGNKLSMPKPHVTGLVDKLISEQMVERVPDPKDRRIINIRITSKGEADFSEIKKEISAEMREKLLTLDEETLLKLADASKLVREVLTSLFMDAKCPSHCCKDLNDIELKNK